MDDIDNNISKLIPLNIELQISKSPDEFSRQEYIITLHDFNDLDQFYNDMETPGGSLYIPSREIPVEKRRPISRNTHYRLTKDEALSIKNDPRVSDVSLSPDESGRKIHPHWVQYSSQWSFSTYVKVGEKNWGLYRHTNGYGLPSNGYPQWIDDYVYADTGDAIIAGTVITTNSGKNVDVVICDGHMNPDHPQFAVNLDGTGGSRIIQRNWFEDNPQVTGGPAGTYTYTYDSSNDDHGCHVGGTAIGNTQGWARDANIYNISPYSNALTVLDYIKYWHVNKPINPITGRQNPTIINCSWGVTYQIPIGTLSAGVYTPAKLIDYIRFRGIVYYTKNWTVYDFAFPLGITGSSLLTAQDSTIIDNSGYDYSIVPGDPWGGPIRQANTISNPTNIVISNAIIPFNNTYSWNFNGAQYVTVDDSPSIEVDTDGSPNTVGFTAEFWVYFNSAPGNATGGRMVIFSGDSVSKKYFRVSFNNTQIIITLTNDNNSERVFSYSVSVGSWYHVAFVRIDGTTILNCFVNGFKLTGVSFDFGIYAPTTLYIGKNPETNTQYFSGYISNLRLISRDLYVDSFDINILKMNKIGKPIEGIGLMVASIGSNWILYTPARYPAIEADVTDLINLGVKVVFAAGNEYTYIGLPTDDITDRYNDYVYTSEGETIYTKRGGIGSVTGSICVGAIQHLDQRAAFSNTGPRIDIWAAGWHVRSSVNNYVSPTFNSYGQISGTITDSRNTEYYEESLSGTSMAAPQVTGYLACLLETYPNLTQSEAQIYMRSTAYQDALAVLIAGTGIDEQPVDNYPGGGYSPGGGFRGILRYYYERPLNGSVFPKANYKSRPTSGVVFPRTGIKSK